MVFSSFLCRSCSSIFYRPNRLTLVAFDMQNRKEYSHEYMLEEAFYMIFVVYFFIEIYLTMPWFKISFKNCENTFVNKIFCRFLVSPSQIKSFFIQIVKIQNLKLVHYPDMIFWMQAILAKVNQVLRYKWKGINNLRSCCTQDASCRQ